MAVRGRIRGVSERSGIFLTGRPQQLIACDDGLVLIPTSAMAAPLGGPLAGWALERRLASETGGDLTATQIGDSQKRARTVRWDEVESALVENRYPGRRLTLVLPDHRYQHKYGKLEPDQFLTALLCGTLSARFRDARSSNDSDMDPSPPADPMSRSRAEDRAASLQRTTDALAAYKAISASDKTRVRQPEKYAFPLGFDDDGTPFPDPSADD